MMIAVLGAGGHGHDLAAIAKASGHRTYFLDDRWKPTHRTSALPYGAPYVIGVNDPATRRRLAAVGGTPTTLVHPTATVDPSATLSAGCVVGAGTTIGPDCFFGYHVHIGPGVTVTRTAVGNYSTISPGVDIAGDVAIGSDCLIGVGAVISNLVTVGARARIGAGAVVVRHVAEDTTVVCRDLTATGVQR